MNIFLFLFLSIQFFFIMSLSSPIESLILLDLLIINTRRLELSTVNILTQCCNTKEYYPLPFHSNNY